MSKEFKDVNCIANLVISKVTTSKRNVKNNISTLVLYSKNGLDGIFADKHFEIRKKLMAEIDKSHQSAMLKKFGILEVDNTSDFVKLMKSSENFDRKSLEFLDSIVAGNESQFSLNMNTNGEISDVNGEHLYIINFGVMYSK